MTGSIHIPEPTCAEVNAKIENANFKTFPKLINLCEEVGCFAQTAETPLGVDLQACVEGGGACHATKVEDVVSENLATAEQAAEAGIEGCKTEGAEGDFTCSAICAHKRRRMMGKDWMTHQKGMQRMHHRHRHGKW